MPAIGERAPDLPTFGGEHPPKLAGTYNSRVTYIHPDGRYYTAKFTFAGGSFLESFLLADTGRAIGRENNIHR